MNEPRAAWQLIDCPHWCEGGHKDSDQVEDRIHRSTGIAIPVIARVRKVRDAADLSEIQASDIEIGISMGDSESTVWIYAGVGRGQELELSAEGMSAVAEQLCRIAREAQVGPV